MTLFWNLKLGRLVTDVGGEVERSAINFKRGDAAEIEILFFRGNVVQVMPTTMEIRFAVKPTNSFSSPPLVFQNAFTRQDWTNPATQEVVVGGRWLADISTNTEQINDYFADEGEPDSVELRGEITYRADDDRGWNSSQTFSVGIDNDLIKGDEGTPTNAEEPTNYITTTNANARYVRYDVAQTLTSGQKTQTRTNIGALEGSGLGVSTSAQTLTDPQKAQVLTNLGLNLNTQVNVYTSGSNTWTNPSPSTPRLCRILMVGGGGGGGSGRKGDATTQCGGGGGGGAGSIIDVITTTNQLGSSLSINVGAGGTGGAVRVTDSTSGANGTAGGDTTITGGPFGATAKGGNFGSGGTGSAGGAAGAGRTSSILIGSTLVNASAGASGALVAGGNAASSAVPLPTGGGGGGGITSSVLYAGGSGGGTGNALIVAQAAAAGGSSDGQQGEDGLQWAINGLGGGGGHSSGSDGTAGNGGAGNRYGGGGGGGGAAGNGSGSSGAGGAGGAGICIIAVF